MSNTFDAVPDANVEHSTAFLELEQPGERLEQIIEEAQLHRGSLREQDGYTIPFREGGSVRIRIITHEPAGLQFSVNAPSTERRDHIQSVIADEIATALGGDHGSLEWQPGQ